MAKQQTISLPPEIRKELKDFHPAYIRKTGAVMTFKKLTCDVIHAGIEALKAGK